MCISQVTTGGMTSMRRGGEGRGWGGSVTEAEWGEDDESCVVDDEGDDAGDGAETEAAHAHQSSGSQSPNHSSGSQSNSSGDRRRSGTEGAQTQRAGSHSRSNSLGA